MALRDQPYLPLYIQDVLTDEKLIECSAESHGVYFRLLCILHKQDTYGLLCLKQKHKQNPSKLICFASMLARQMPFKTETIAKALEELTEENVLVIDGDTLFQKRMVHDGQISLMRTEVGKKGGSSVTKQYGRSGYLYLMSDGDKLHKIGISVNPKNRLYRLRSSLKLSKLFDIVDVVEVNDMGIAEDLAHAHFGKLMDGEWVKDASNTVVSSFALLKANVQAKSQPNTENENETNNEGYSKTNNLTVTELSDNYNGDESFFEKWGEPTPYKANPEFRTWIVDQEYSDSFKLNWIRYLDYMVMLGKAYMDDISQGHKMKELWSNAKTESEAMECINQTISDNNKSFYELKKNKKDGTKINGTTSKVFGQKDYSKKL